MSEDLPAAYGGTPIREDVLGYGSQSITDHEKAAVAEALDGDYITRGPTVDEFERRVAELVGVDHAIATTSGTTALHLTGDAAGFGPGDEVITTPLTFASTAHAATYNDATPVFADIDPHRRTLDPEAVREQITDDTVGIIPMHYAGHPADIEGILDVADEHDLTVIWDACHAFGGTWREESLGAQRDMAMFSFHPVKNVTTGEGGMVVTDDDELAARLRRLRSFDMNYEPEGHDDEPWYQVTEGLGYNYNVTDLQAALGLAQLDRLTKFKQRRDEIIDQYNAAFAEIEGVRTPPEPVGPTRCTTCMRSRSARPSAVTAKRSSMRCTTRTSVSRSTTFRCTTTRTSRRRSATSGGSSPRRRPSTMASSVCRYTPRWMTATLRMS